MGLLKKEKETSDLKSTENSAIGDEEKKSVQSDNAIATSGGEEPAHSVTESALENDGTKKPYNMAENSQEFPVSSKKKKAEIVAKNIVRTEGLSKDLEKLNSGIISENALSKRTETKTSKEGIGKKLIWFAVFVVTIVLIGNMALVTLLICTKGITADVLSAAYIGSLLSNGLTIIAVAIAVWTGLNISNSVNRRELNEMHQKTIEINQTSFNVQQSLKSVQEGLDALHQPRQEIVETMKCAFLGELIKSNKDEISLWFYDNFSSLFERKNTEWIFNGDLFQKMIVIEQLYAVVYEYHTSELKNKKETLSLTKEAIELVSDVIDRKSESVKKSVGGGLIVNYLSFRLAEFLFYRGYALSTDSQSEKCKAYLEAVEIYKETEETFFTNDSVFIELNDKEKALHVLYFQNTILECYHKLIICDKGEPKETQQKNLKDALSCASALWENLSKRVECKQISELPEVYYRNLGCLYESVDRENKNMANADRILSMYEKSLLAAVNDDHKTVKYRVESIYHVLVQYMNKCINPIGLFVKGYQCIEDKTAEIMKKQYMTLRFAQKEFPRVRLYYSSDGLLCVLIAKAKYEGVIIDFFRKNADEYYKKAKRDLDILKYIYGNKPDPRDDYFTKLNEYVETLSELFETDKPTSEEIESLTGETTGENQ